MAEGATKAETTAPAVEKAKRTRKTDGKVGLTFVYKDETGAVITAVHRTKRFSVDEAFKEYAEKHTLNEKCELAGAFRAQQEFMKNKIRNPTKQELYKLAGLSAE